MPDEAAKAPAILQTPEGETIAYRRIAPKQGGAKTGLLWLGGFKSDMDGTKAAALARYADRAGRAFVRFDYFGHGLSSGDFLDGTIGRWKKDALQAIDELSEGPLVLIGSSMGGWIALLAALERPDQVKGLVLIAPAPDMTEVLMWERWSDEIRGTIERDGVYEQPSDYDDEPYRISRALIEEGRAHLLLGGPVAFEGPVRILQGMADEDVPWEHALKLVDALTSKDVSVTFVKHGDHRLSTPQDLERLNGTIETLCRALEG